LQYFIHLFIWLCGWDCFTWYISFRRTQLFIFLCPV
jgi:hypothetical protein